MKIRCTYLPREMYISFSRYIHIFFKIYTYLFQEMYISFSRDVHIYFPSPIASEVYRKKKGGRCLPKSEL